MRRHFCRNGQVIQKFYVDPQDQTYQNNFDEKEKNLENLHYLFLRLTIYLQ